MFRTVPQDFRSKKSDAGRMLNNLIRVSGVLACAGALIASASSSQNRGGMRERCTGPKGQSGFVNGAGVCETGFEESYRIEALKRDHTIRTEREVDGVMIAAVPAGAAAWQVRIENTSDDTMTVLWDESSFVTSDGKAAGRLIRGETRKIDTGKTQPPEPVPPHAHVDQVVFAEKLIDLETEEEKITSVNLPMEGITMARKYRANRNALLVGGKMHVSLTTADGKKTWTGVVVPLGDAK